MIATKIAKNEAGLTSLNLEKVAGEREYHIAIIGGGPKGMYGLERLAANLKANPVNGKVVIYIFNRSLFFGSGDVYRSDQPEYLKMNVCNAEVDAWIRDYPEPVVPEVYNFIDWKYSHKEAREIVKDEEYSSRAAVGEYLESVFQQILDHLPANVQVRKFVGEVIDLERNEKSQYLIHLNDNEGNLKVLPHGFDHVLMATGHPKRELTKDEEYQSNIKPNKGDNTGNFIPHIYPVQKQLKNITPGCRVALKGMGLTFVDAVLALTEGRRGGFVFDREGKMTYRPSGNEPAVIYPFSRSGLPMRPRGATVINDEEKLRFFTAENISDLLNDSIGKINFEKDLWPLLKKEMEFAYYRVLLRNYDFELRESEDFSYADLKSQIMSFHRKYPELPLFDLKKFLNPGESEVFANGQAYNDFITSYLVQANSDAKVGLEKNPNATVARVWSLANSVFGNFYKFGGLSPVSQKVFDEKYCSMLNRVSYGPPVENMEKIITLAKAGIIDFGIGPASKFRFDDSSFYIKSDYFHKETEVDFLIDARIPKVSLKHSKKGLYHRLRIRGEISEFKNKCEKTGKVYKPGCMDLNEEGSVIDSNKIVNPAITVTGTPTEGVTYDNDALSPTRNNFVSRWAENLVRKIKKEESNEVTR